MKQTKPFKETIMATQLFSKAAHDLATKLDTAQHTPSYWVHTHRFQYNQTQLSLPGWSLYNVKALDKEVKEEKNKWLSIFNSIQKQYKLKQRKEHLKCEAIFNESFERIQAIISEWSQLETTKTAAQSPLIYPHIKQAQKWHQKFYKKRQKMSYEDGLEYVQTFIKVGKVFAKDKVCQKPSDYLSHTETVFHDLFVIVSETFASLLMIQLFYISQQPKEDLLKSDFQHMISQLFNQLNQHETPFWLLAKDLNLPSGHRQNFTFFVLHILSFMFEQSSFHKVKKHLLNRLDWDLYYVSLSHLICTPLTNFDAFLKQPVKDSLDSFIITNQAYKVLHFSFLLVSEKITTQHQSWVTDFLKALLNHCSEKKLDAYFSLYIQTLALLLGPEATQNCLFSFIKTLELNELQSCRTCLGYILNVLDQDHFKQESDLWYNSPSFVNQWQIFSRKYVLQLPFSTWEKLFEGIHCNELIQAPLVSSLLKFYQHHTTETQLINLLISKLEQQQNYAGLMTLALTFKRENVQAPLLNAYFLQMNVFEDTLTQIMGKFNTSHNIQDSTAQREWMDIWLKELIDTIIDASTTHPINFVLLPFEKEIDSIAHLLVQALVHECRQSKLFFHLLSTLLPHNQDILKSCASKVHDLIDISSLKLSYFEVHGSLTEKQFAKYLLYNEPYDEDLSLTALNDITESLFTLVLKSTQKVFPKKDVQTIFDRCFTTLNVECPHPIPFDVQQLLDAYSSSDISTAEKKVSDYLQACDSDPSIYPNQTMRIHQCLFLMQWLHLDKGTPPFTLTILHSILEIGYCPLHGYSTQLLTLFKLSPPSPLCLKTLQKCLEYNIFRDPNSRLQLMDIIDHQLQVSTQELFHVEQNVITQWFKSFNTAILAKKYSDEILEFYQRLLTQGYIHETLPVLSLFKLQSPLLKPIKTHHNYYTEFLSICQGSTQQFPDLKEKQPLIDKIITQHPRFLLSLKEKSPWLYLKAIVLFILYAKNNSKKQTLVNSFLKEALPQSLTSHTEETTTFLVDYIQNYESQTNLNSTINHFFGSLSLTQQMGFISLFSSEFNLFSNLVLHYPKVTKDDQAPLLGHTLKLKILNQCLEQMAFSKDYPSHVLSHLFDLIHQLEIQKKQRFNVLSESTRNLSNAFTKGESFSSDLYTITQILLDHKSELISHIKPTLFNPFTDHSQPYLNQLIAAVDILFHLHQEAPDSFNSVSKQIETSLFILIKTTFALLISESKPQFSSLFLRRFFNHIHTFISLKLPIVESLTCLETFNTRDRFRFIELMAHCDPKIKETLFITLSQSLRIWEDLQEFWNVSVCTSLIIQGLSEESIMQSCQDITEQHQLIESIYPYNQALAIKLIKTTPLSTQSKFKCIQLCTSSLKTDFPERDYVAELIPELFQGSNIPAPPTQEQSEHIWINKRHLYLLLKHDSKTVQPSFIKYLSHCFVKKPEQIPSLLTELFIINPSLMTTLFEENKHQLQTKLIKFIQHFYIWESAFHPILLEQCIKIPGLIDTLYKCYNTTKKDPLVDLQTCPTAFLFEFIKQKKKVSISDPQTILQLLDYATKRKLLPVLSKYFSDWMDVITQLCSSSLFSVQNQDQVSQNEGIFNLLNNLSEKDLKTCCDQLMSHYHVDPLQLITRVMANKQWMPFIPNRLSFVQRVIASLGIQSDASYIRLAKKNLPKPLACLIYSHVLSHPCVLDLPDLLTIFSYIGFIPESMDQSHKDTLNRAILNPLKQSHFVDFSLASPKTFSSLISLEGIGQQLAIAQQTNVISARFLQSILKAISLMISEEASYFMDNYVSNQTISTEEKGVTDDPILNELLQSLQKESNTLVQNLLDTINLSQKSNDTSNKQLYLDSQIEQLTYDASGRWAFLNFLNRYAKSWKHELLASLIANWETQQSLWDKLQLALKSEQEQLALEEFLHNLTMSYLNDTFQEDVSFNRELTSVVFLIHHHQKSKNLILKHFAQHLAKNVTPNKLNTLDSILASELLDQTDKFTVLTPLLSTKNGQFISDILSRGKAYGLFNSLFKQFNAQTPAPVLLTRHFIEGSPLDKCIIDFIQQSVCDANGYFECLDFLSLSTDAIQHYICQVFNRAFDSHSAVAPSENKGLHGLIKIAVVKQDFQFFKLLGQFLHIQISQKNAHLQWMYQLILEVGTVPQTLHTQDLIRLGYIDESGLIGYKWKAPENIHMNNNYYNDKLFHRHFLLENLLTFSPELMIGNDKNKGFLHYLLALSQLTDGHHHLIDDCFSSFADSQHHPILETHIKTWSLDKIMNLLTHKDRPNSIKEMIIKALIKKDANRSNRVKNWREQLAQQLVKATLLLEEDDLKNAILLNCFTVDPDLFFPLINSHAWFKDLYKARDYFIQHMQTFNISSLVTQTDLQTVISDSIDNNIHGLDTLIVTRAMNPDFPGLYKAALSVIDFQRPLYDSNMDHFLGGIFQILFTTETINLAHIEQKLWQVLTRLSYEETLMTHWLPHYNALKSLFSAIRNQHYTDILSTKNQIIITLLFYKQPEKIKSFCNHIPIKMSPTAWIKAKISPEKQQILIPKLQQNNILDQDLNIKEDSLKKIHLIPKLRQQLQDTLSTTLKKQLQVNRHLLSVSLTLQYYFHLLKTETGWSFKKAFITVFSECPNYKWSFIQVLLGHRDPTPNKLIIQQKIQKNMSMPCPAFTPESLQGLAKNLQEELKNSKEFTEELFNKPVVTASDLAELLHQI